MKAKGFLPLSILLSSLGGSAGEEENVSLLPIDDADLDSWNPNMNYGSSSEIEISSTFKGLFRFDTTNIVGTIDDASLQLHASYCSTTDSTAPTTVTFTKIEVNVLWDESDATWNTITPNYSPIGSPKEVQFDCPEDSALTILGSTLFSASNPSNFPSLNVTDWAGEKDVFTILVESEGTERIYSKEATTGAKRPTIQLTSTSASTPSSQLVIPADCSAGGSIGEQSQFCHQIDDSGTPKFDWNITILEFMSIDKPTTQQGIYNLRSTYIMDERSYDVELFKENCINAPSGIDSFPLVFKQASNTDSGSSRNTIELEWTYNQTKIESSDLWTSTKTGGYAEFCIRLNNYLEENDDPFARQIHFLEVKYRIEVDSLTDFNSTIAVDRVDATDGGTDFINYEEEIEVFQCRDNYSEITTPVPLTQGDFLQLCVRTIDGSKFGVHSIKELDVSQQDDTPIIFSYVDGFVDSPLTESMCKANVKNTTNAICKTKMQLLSSYFDLDNPVDLFANGTVKLDYVGRRLSVNVPVTLPRSYGGTNSNGGSKEVAAADRVLADKDPSFGIEIATSVGDGSRSDASILSVGGLFSVGMTFLTAGI